MLRFFAAIAICLVNTSFAARQAQLLGCPAEKIRIVPQGTNLEEFPFSPKPAPVPGEELRLLSVSRIVPEKGLEYAVRAVAQLVSRGINARYTVVGTGPTLGRLHQLVNNLKIANRVEFAGQLPPIEVASRYRTSHVVLFPSVALEGPYLGAETQGIILQEAQASGTLVVATRSGGIPECVAEGAGAWLVPEKDSDAICAAVEAILAAPQHWSEWQIKGRKWVEERFDLSLIAPRLLEIVAEVMEGNDLE